MLFIESTETIISILIKSKMGTIQFARGIEFSSRGITAMALKSIVITNSWGFSSPTCLLPISRTASMIKKYIIPALIKLIVIKFTVNIVRSFLFNIIFGE